MKINQILAGKGKRVLPMLVIVMVAVAGGATYASFIMSRQVTTSMTIKGVDNMNILDFAENVLSSISFGNLNRDETKLYPTTEYYFIRNTGDYGFWVSYTISDKPADVAFTVEVYHEGNGVWSQLADGVIYSAELKDHHADDIRWRITLDVDPMAALASYAPTITWSAFDTDSG